MFPLRVTNYKLSRTRWYKKKIKKTCRFLGSVFWKLPQQSTVLINWLFIYFYFEWWQVESVYNKSVVTNYASLVNTLPFKILKFLALKSYNLIYMGWCLTPFIFLSYDRWIEVFKSIHYFGFVYCFIWFIIYKVYKVMSSKSRNHQERTSRATDLSPTINEEHARDSKATDLSPTPNDNKKDN